MGITIVISLYSTRLILSALGASDFGIYSIVGGSIAMLSFLNSTMANATQRFMSFAEGEGVFENKVKVFNTSLILHIIIGILTLLILFLAYIPLFGGILNIATARISSAKIIYFCLLISAFLTIVNVPYEAIINAHEDMLFFSIMGVMESLLKLAIAIICSYSSHDRLILYGVLMLCVPLISFIVMRFFCHKKYSECEISFNKSIDLQLLKDIASFSGWNFLTAITFLLSGQGLGIILNHFFGTTLNAAHGIANQVNSQLCAFAENMRKALNPFIVKSAGSNNRNRMNYAAMMGCKYSSLLTLFFAIPLILEMPYVLRIWLKNVPDFAVLFCRLQLIQSIIIQLSGSLATSIYANGKIKYYAIYKSITNALPAILTYVSFSLGGGPIWLYIPLIVIWGVCGNIVILYFAKSQCDQSISEYCNTVLVPLISVSLIMLIAGSFIIKLQNSGFIRLILCCLTTTIAMMFSCLLFVFSKSEKMVFQREIKRFF